MTLPSIAPQTDSDLSKYATRRFLLYQLSFQGLTAVFTPAVLCYPPFSLENCRLPFFKPGATLLSIPIAVIVYMFFERWKYKEEGELSRWTSLRRLQFTRTELVWLFIFIIGATTVNLNISNQYLSLFSFESQDGFRYLSDMFRVAMISILAYLASNIIREMLKIKDGYSNMQEKVDIFLAKGDEFVNDLETAEKTIKDMVQMNKIIAPINELRLQVTSPINGILPSKTMVDQLGLFSENVESYTKTLTQLNKDTDFRIWSFSLLNKYIESNRYYMDKYETIFIPYSELKSVVARFMKVALNDEMARALDKDKRYRFFALFSGSPPDFFPSNSDPLKAYGYCKSNFAIKKANETGRSTGIERLTRIFINVDKEDFPSQFPMKEIFVGNVHKELSNKSKAREILGELIDDAKKFQKKIPEEQSFKENFQREYIADLEALLHQTPDLDLKALIEFYHGENCAKMLYLVGEEKERLLEKREYGGREKQYIKDYFAIQRYDPEKGHHVWSYCLSGAFHPTFNAIEINLYNENQEGKNERTDKTWDDICDDLRFFFERPDDDPNIRAL